MATTLFMRNTAADTHLGTDNANLRGTNVSWDSKEMLTTRGPGLATAGAGTSTGPTAGIEAVETSFANEWISPPVSADVTISGTITANIWASEDAMNTNVAINVIIEIIRANTTTTRNSNTLVEIVRSTRTTEVAVTTRAVNNFTTGMTSGAYTAQTLNRGDRLRIRIYADDAGTMGVGTFSISYSGTTAAADGDTFVTFTETIAFESAPSGTQLFLTDAAAGFTDTVSNTGFLTAGTLANLDRGGLVDWINPGNASASDNSYATAVNAGSGTDYLVASNFGASIPAGSAIRGIAVEVEGKTSVGTDNINLQLQNDSSALIGSANFGISLTTTESVFTQGGQDSQQFAPPLDLTKAMVENANFGVRLWSTSATPETLSIDSIRLKIFYAPTNIPKEAWTSRGAGVVNTTRNTVAGWTIPLQFTDTTVINTPSYTEWYTRALTAFTLGGMAQANLRAAESGAADNISLRLEIARVDGDGTNPTVWSSWCIAPTGTDKGELTTSEVARTANVSGDDLAVSNGQRLRFRIYIDDISTAAMGGSGAATFYYAGTSAAASGDSYITLPQSVTELVAVLVHEYGFVNFNDPGVL